MKQPGLLCLFAASLSLTLPANAFGLRAQESAPRMKPAEIPCGISGRTTVCTTIDFPGADNTQAWGINSRGEIVGTYVSGGAMHGFLLNRSGFRRVRRVATRVPMIASVVVARS